MVPAFDIRIPTLVGIRQSGQVQFLFGGAAHFPGPGVLSGWCIIRAVCGAGLDRRRAGLLCVIAGIASRLGHGAFGAFRVARCARIGALGYLGLKRRARGSATFPSIWVFRAVG